MRKLLWFLVITAAFVIQQADAQQLVTNLAWSPNSTSNRNVGTWKVAGPTTLVLCRALSSQGYVAAPIVQFSACPTNPALANVFACTVPRAVGAGEQCPPGSYSGEAFILKSAVATSAAPPPVDCVVSAWSDWLPTGDWSDCVNSSQSRQEQRTRTVVTPPANGGAVCPVLVETRIVTQACVVANPPLAPYQITVIINHEKCWVLVSAYGFQPNVLEAQKRFSDEIIRSDPLLAPGNLDCAQLGIEEGQAVLVRFRRVNVGGPGAWSGYWPIVRFTPTPADPLTRDDERIEYMITKNRGDGFTGP